MTKREPPGADSAPGLPRLPPGRHGLPREFVTENQRGRLAAGIIAAVAENGYHETTITEIASRAGVSRRTFYTYFSSKQECFLDTYDLIAGHLTEAMIAAGAAHAEWPDRVEAQVGALLETFAANPDLVRFCLIAPPNAGGEIADHYRVFLQSLIATLTESIPPPPATRQPSDAVEQAVVGGIAALIVREVKAGEGGRLPELLPDLLELALAPFLGREEALRAARRTP